MDQPREKGQKYHPKSSFLTRQYFRSHQGVGKKESHFPTFSIFSFSCDQIGIEWKKGGEITLFLSFFDPIGPNSGLEVNLYDAKERDIVLCNVPCWEKQFRGLSFASISCWEIHVDVGTFIPWTHSATDSDLETWARTHTCARRTQQTSCKKVPRRMRCDGCMKKEALTFEGWGEKTRSTFDLTLFFPIPFLRFPSEFIILDREEISSAFLFALIASAMYQYRQSRLMELFFPIHSSMPCFAAAATEIANRLKQQQQKEVAAIIPCLAINNPLFHSFFHFLLIVALVSLVLKCAFYDLPPPGRRCSRTCVPLSTISWLRKVGRLFCTHHPF